MLLSQLSWYFLITNSIVIVSYKNKLQKADRIRGNYCHSLEVYESGIFWNIERNSDRLLFEVNDQIFAISLLSVYQATNSLGLVNRYQRRILLRDRFFTSVCDTADFRGLKTGYLS